MKYIQTDCEILDIKQLTSTIYDITIKCVEMADLSKVGQFVHIRCGDKTLRRPISICQIDKENGTLRLVYEVRGEGTLWISKQKIGDMIDVLGPLGNGFDVSETNDNVIFVGGGIGVPPLLGTSKLFGEKATVILGFRNKDAVILEDDFKNVTSNVNITTDDGSYGFHGLVTDVLKQKLNDEGGYARIYSCGPTPMLKAISAIADEYDIECQVSLEERMGCGVGACLVCACKTKDKENKEHMKHVCKNGPVFNSKEVVW